MFFLFGHSGVLVNASGNIDPFQAIVPLARNQGHDNQGEIWMSLITYGSIHETHEWFGNDSRGNEIFYVWLFYYVSNFADSRMEVPRY